MLIGEPSSTESGAGKGAVGATLSTVTLSEYSLTPRSLSRIAPLTCFKPLSLVGQECVVSVPQAVQVVPSSQLKRYSKPAVVSTEEGSLGSVSERPIGEPSSTESGAVKVAMGATLLTVTLSLYSLAPRSLSRIEPLTAFAPLSLVG